MLIHFEDHGQDFLTWHLNNDGIVVNSLPFQSFVWCKIQVIAHRDLMPGDLVRYRRSIGEKSRQIRYPVIRIERDLRAAEFSARHPIGTPCRYYPYIGNDDFIRTRIVTDAWEQRHDGVVVYVEGRSSAVDVHHLVMEG